MVRRAASKHQSFVGFFFISFFLLADSHEQALKEVLSGVSVLGLYGSVCQVSTRRCYLWGLSGVLGSVRPELPFSMCVCKSYSQLIFISGVVLSLKSCNELSDVCNWNDWLSLRRRTVRSKDMAEIITLPVHFNHTKKNYM